MRKLQEVKLTINKGKQEKKEEVGKPRKVVDSAAEHYEREAKSMIEQAKATGKLQIITVWEDLGEVKKGEKPKKEAPKKD